MNRTFPSPRLLARAALATLVLVIVAGTPSAAWAQSVPAKALVVSVAERGTFIDVQLQVSVTNEESSVASSVFVVFEDGLQVAFGDIQAGQSAVSPTQTISLDVSAMPTQNPSVPVRVTFLFNGQSVAQAQTLIVHRPTAPDPVQ